MGRSKLPFTRLARDILECPEETSAMASSKKVSWGLLGNAAWRSIKWAQPGGPGSISRADRNANRSTRLTCARQKESYQRHQFPMTGL